ncbi:MAG: NADP-dependent oxidoreductase [Ilumatobacter sp.]|uniref:NADP-dependent oxidoreductase n=1 Tax=Ilumatobacter sp. TaxID=1967498 RepID=UPI00260DF13A|nr:NADP-dependent oxidoreductase [Ilumatobacter sp.]MDJ0768955.1 NADP-dependent oxidoreductase [Ilumatobacter sp.]
MTTNTQVLLAETPRGKLDESHFEIRAGDVPPVADGQVLVRNVLLSIDAANRAWMQGATYKSAVEAGQVMHGYAIGEVVDTNSPAHSVGDVVAGELGWQEYAAMDAAQVRPVGDHRPLTHHHSVLGIAGITAYHGLLTLFGIDEGETLLVSAAAGSVGSLVGQIGKIKGAHVVGIAGGPEKCAWVVDELGFDACIDYKNERLSAALRERCPDGVDVYFDNVGGPILEAALFAMNLHGRISCCGAVSQYDSPSPTGPRGVPGLIVTKRLTLRGFIAMDFPEHDAAAIADLGAWAASGQLQVVEDVVGGLEHAPQALIGLLAGENRGKRMVRVGPDPA